MPLTSWLDKHKQNYLAHAIWSDNVDKVLKTTILKPAEQILRENLNVSYEGGMYGTRIKMDMATIYRHFKEKNIRLPRCVNVDSPRVFIMSLTEAVDQYYITEEQAKEFFIARIESLPESKEISEGITFRKSGSKKMIVARNQLKLSSHFLGLDKSNTHNVRTHLTEYCAEFKCHELPIQIASDLLQVNPIDKLLAEFWNAKSKICDDKQKLFSKLFNIRTYEISTSSVNPEIRASRNRVLWKYGEVVVLIGNPKSYLSISNSENEEKTNLGKQIASIVLGAEEVCFKHPIENNGEFLSVDLKQQDILVIGPEVKLSPYLNCGMDLVTIESMNQEELDFFQVPASLRKTQVHTHSVLFPRGNNNAKADLEILKLNAISEKTSVTAAPFQ